MKERDIVFGGLFEIHKDIRGYSDDPDTELGIPLEIIEGKDQDKKKYPIFPMVFTYNVTLGKYAWLRADMFIERVG